MQLFKALVVSLAFLTWGLLIALASGATWGTHQAGIIATVSSLLALIYGSATYRSSRKRLTKNTKSWKK
ncbi:hypothetical protein O3W44_22500 [Pantoea sp. LMR881]|uniref:hypothetical protein n=1 Tax=Pantoea sp. LMR881 TaxID=3014336 RepID=UPI0022AF83C9|nr:hypothetical protein [Pantoea sp. LMR881]MCZ4061194.1 hypothetical protein [Pantoea sp. LMR881]MCZ4061305.1 hypothetical protein [Pantoea sp. LMR881]